MAPVCSYHIYNVYEHNTFSQLSYKCHPPPGSTAWSPSETAKRLPLTSCPGSLFPHLTHPSSASGACWSCKGKIRQPAPQPPKRGPCTTLYHQQPPLQASPSSFLPQALLPSILLTPHTQRDYSSKQEGGGGHLGVGSRDLLLLHPLLLWSPLPCVQPAYREAGGRAGGRRARATVATNKSEGEGPVAPPPTSYRVRNLSNGSGEEGPRAGGGGGGTSAQQSTRSRARPAPDQWWRKEGRPEEAEKMNVPTHIPARANGNQWHWRGSERPSPRLPALPPTSSRSSREDQRWEAGLVACAMATGAEVGVIRWGRRKQVVGWFFFSCCGGKVRRGRDLALRGLLRGKL